MRTEPVDDGFAQVVAALKAAPVRSDVQLEELPSPTRLARHAWAVSGELSVGDDVLADGRFVLMQGIRRLDPGPPPAPDAWRVVVLARAEVDPEMAADPLLTAVGWSWLTDMLDRWGGRAAALGGTVTRLVSDPFGTLAGGTGERAVEIRASWTPLWADPTVSAPAHLHAWADLLAATGGLPVAGSDDVDGYSRRRHTPM